MAIASYTLMQEIGRGSFGVCYLVKRSLPGSEDSLCVVKEINTAEMSRDEAKKVESEARIMRSLKHPNIIDFVECFKTKSGQVCIVMEYADAGNLKNHIDKNRGPLPEDEVVRMVAQICLALKFLHERNILHRDLKLENIFLTKEGVVKLGDFGASKQLTSQSDKASTQIGTPFYLSPELIADQPYSFSTDVWAVGILIYELCTRRPPFTGRTIPELCSNILNGVAPPLPPQFSQDLQDLVSQLLVKDPLQRPTIGAVLKHRVMVAELYTRLLQRREEPKPDIPFVPPLPPFVVDECVPEGSGDRRLLLAEIARLRTELNSIVLPGGNSPEVLAARNQINGNPELLEVKQVILEDEEKKVQLPPAPPLESGRSDLQDKAGLLRARLTRKLGEERMRSIYAVMSQAMDEPGFTSCVVPFFSPRVEHLLPKSEHALYLPQFIHLLKLDRGK